MLFLYVALLVNPIADDVKKPPEVQYVFVEDLKEWVVMQRAGVAYWGRLDAAGNFLHDAGRTSVPKDAMHKSGLPEARELNFPRGGEQETVYEYRSGRLIKGVLDKDGEFIPELKSKAVLLRDYKYHPKALRIYNLPGRFKPKSK